MERKFSMGERSYSNIDMTVCWTFLDCVENKIKSIKTDSKTFQFSNFETFSPMIIFHWSSGNVNIFLIFLWIKIFNLVGKYFKLLMESKNLKAITN